MTVIPPSDMPSNSELHKKRLEVIRHHNDNVPIMKIVKLAGLSYPAVKMAIELYHKGGVGALKPPPRGRKTGEKRLLNKNQEAELCHILYEAKPSEFGIKKTLWDRSIVRELIAKKYGVTLSPRGVGKYIERCGIPVFPQNYQPIDGCIKKIRKQVLNNKEIFDKYLPGSIFWVSQRRIETDRQRLIISAIDNNRKEYWIITNAIFSTKTQIKFFNALSKISQRCLTIIIKQDTHLYTSKTLNNWFYNNKTKVTLFPRDQNFYAEMKEMIKQKKEHDEKAMEKLRLETSDWYL